MHVKQVNMSMEELTPPQSHHPWDGADRRWEILADQKHTTTSVKLWWCWIIFAVFMQSPLVSARCRAAKVHTSRQKYIPVVQRDYSPGHSMKERVGTHRQRHTETSGSTTGSTETWSDQDKPTQVRDFGELRCREWRQGSQPAPCTPWTGERALNCTDLLLQIGISIVISASCL